MDLGPPYNLIIDGPPDNNDETTTTITPEPTSKGKSLHFTCPHCSFTGDVIVKQGIPFIAYLLMVILTCLFGISVSILTLPTVIYLTWSSLHTCPSCSKNVGSDANPILRCLEMQNKIPATLCRIFLILLLGVIIYAQFESNRPYRHPIIPIRESWEELLSECGRLAIEEYKTERMRHCENKYLEKTVINWKGYVIRVEDYRNGLYNFMHHALVIPVKMSPSESEFFPDIILALDSEITNKLLDEILSFDKGMQISFNATIISLGHDRKTRHMHVTGLKKESEFMQVSELVHSQGRYADKPKFLRTIPNS